MKGCILFKGAKNNKGYGMVTRNCKTQLAHRLAFQDKYPRVDITKHLILHRCDVRLCINPKHLFRGTAKENTQDMMKKGRGNWAHGERAAHAKLTEEDVIFIRKNYVKKQKPALHHAFGVTKGTVLSIIKNKSWRHVNV